MRQVKTKLNTILLINNPQEFDDKSTSAKAYKNLEEDLVRNYNNQNRILILRYSLDETQTIRSLRLFSLEKNSKGEKEITFVFDYGNIKFTEPAFLGLVFYYIQDVFPSDHTILMTWGHGYGVGLFKDSSYVIPIIDNDYSLADYEFVYQSRNKNQRSRTGLAGSSPENIFMKTDLSDMLTNAELNEAILMGYRTVNENNKIDMMIFMNCDMMRFDTVYDLANSTKYIVAPQTPISWSGYNYNEFLKIVNKYIDALDKDSTWKIFCNNLTSKFKSKYTGKKAIEANRVCIAAVETEKVNKTFDLFNLILFGSLRDPEIMEKWLNVILTLDDENLDTSNAWCIDANKPRKTDSFFSLKNFDLQNLVSSLISEFKDRDEMKTSFEELSMGIEELVITFKPCKLRGSVKNNFKGISITLPRTLDELESHIFFKDYNMVGTNNRDAFAFCNIWAEFLTTLYKFREFNEQLKNH